jgi:hypothetical protein
VPADPDGVERSRTLQSFWLCPVCCSAMTVGQEGNHVNARTIDEVRAAEKKLQELVNALEEGWCE